MRKGCPTRTYTICYTYSSRSHHYIRRVLLCLSYNTAVDVWSCGCVLAELHLRSPLLPAATDTQQLQRIFRRVVHLVGSPEVLLCLSYNTAVDVWSCGCVLAELHLRSPLLPAATDTQQLQRIFR
ncbi:unnamed protein product [Plutella xylostella]|uniref:(diamondback moth) hypothetical protein n=1 Tax=Plutella xylostella TaxID=51655 RepID=A0A8S4G5D6_PLUXY|nr:unnamed protein product [Plutella xylostella]